jgi:transcription antitermination factor NusG
VRVNLEEVGLSVFNWMPYSTGLVSFGGEPAVVSDALIHAVKQRILQVEQAGGELFANLHQGDSVVIQDGPFDGYEAIFDIRLPGSERVRILLKMLNDRNVPMELRAGQNSQEKVLTSTSLFISQTIESEATSWLNFVRHSLLLEYTN